MILSGYVLCKDKVENFGYVKYLNFFVNLRQLISEASTDYRYDTSRRRTITPATCIHRSSHIYIANIHQQLRASKCDKYVRTIIYADIDMISRERARRDSTYRDNVSACDVSSLTRGCCHPPTRWSPSCNRKARSQRHAIAGLCAFIRITQSKRNQMIRFTVVVRNNSRGRT